jgi:ABC-type glycerol-3-phosphate transport system substrate-binding protein
MLSTAKTTAEKRGASKEENMAHSPFARPRPTRRSVLKSVALGSVAAIAAPHVRHSYAAGTLALGVWDHWVPNANNALTALCNEWGAKNSVEVKIDFITSQGEKDKLTAAAEAQAGTGHDIMTHRDWNVRIHAETLEPLDDISGELIKQYGPISPVFEYLGKIKGHWMAVPTCYGSAAGPPCARIDLLKEYVGLDVQKMYPVGSPDQALTDQWTWDYLLTAAEKCMKAGKPFGIGLSTCTDAINMAGSVFASFGADLVDAEGTITVKTDATRQVLEWFQKLAKTLPDSVYAYDNASNNKALISGQSALIMNPPSAWAVAKRDAPQVAEQCWTHGFPVGPKGRFAPFLPYYWSIWKFAKNKEAAKSLLVHLSQPASVEKLVAASGGYDLPAFEKLTTLKTWAEEGPPKGTLYHYPNPYNHQVLSIAASPAPPKIAQQIYTQAILTKMCLRYHQGEAMEKTLAWAEGECEGYMRS